MYLCHIPEYQRRADNFLFRIQNRACGGSDSMFLTASCDEQHVVGPSDDLPRFKHLTYRVDCIAFPTDLEDLAYLRVRPSCGLRRRPPCQILGFWIQANDATVDIGGDRGIADDVEHGCVRGVDRFLG